MSRTIWESGFPVAAWARRKSLVPSGRSFSETSGKVDGAGLVAVMKEELSKITTETSVKYNFVKIIVVILDWWGYFPPMIPFDEIDARLAAIGKNRVWLAEKSGRSPSSIRSALAPNAADKQRSALLQKALTDAIESEERAQREQRVATIQLPDRISLEASAAERELWEACSLAAQLTLSAWAVAQLNQAAQTWQKQEEKSNGTHA